MNKLDLILSAHKAMLGEITANIRFMVGKFNNKKLSIRVIIAECSNEVDVECVNEITTGMIADCKPDILLEEEIVKSDSLSWKNYPEYDLLYFRYEGR